MLATDIDRILNKLEEYEAEGDGDGIDCYREHAASLLYKARDIVKQYEFLATHVSYMQIDFDWGGRDKIYNDSKTIDAFSENVLESIEMNKPAEDE